ncbi:uncharacterized protein LOC143145044 isoform X1 [Ptiloglossa arizonensis]|uniref:uncharacterized protein LOC143145044 isoform X1 n=1 Tax=Ptiloglossa arizonensis TaxID=3350558 RepID=UPI003FA02B65
MINDSKHLGSYKDKKIPGLVEFDTSRVFQELWKSRIQVPFLESSMSSASTLDLGSQKSSVVYTCFHPKFRVSIVTSSGSSVLQSTDRGSWSRPHRDRLYIFSRI